MKNKLREVTAIQARAIVAWNAKFFCAALALAGVGAAMAQDDDTITTAPIVVSPTRVEQSSFDLPVSVDAFDKQEIQQGQPMVNLSETLSKAPGVVANNRQNYAQDLQISIRGFGARSTFGVRGIRLYADGIPLTMPDGQGQAANLDLASARSIEVLRGPFSSLYGLSSGGVVSVFTEDGPEQPTLTGSGWYGSYDSSRVGLKFGGQDGALNYIGDVGQFDTDGYRDHSAATRNTFNTKLRYSLGNDSTVTFVANYLMQPETQDPQGLTKTEAELTPRAASPAALQFNTRKSIDNLQSGLVFEHRLTDEDTLRVMGYTGDRQVQQYLSVPVGSQAAPNSGGGVIDLDRQFGGLDLRWTRKTELAARPFTFTAGLNYDRQTELRKGWENFVGAEIGIQGRLRRDEDDVVYNFDQYLQGEWTVAERWIVSAGVRHSKVNFESTDHFVNVIPGNGDDSGSVSFNKTAPVAGVVFKVSPVFNLYANAGKGFETPTFSELAYRPSGAGAGLNFDLKPAESNNYEVGAKAFLGSHTRMNVALFRIETDDEIVVLSNTGGRTVYQNAGKTQREGAEVMIQSELGYGFSTLASLTYINAEYKESFLTCTSFCGSPTTTIPSGNNIPGIPQSTAYGELLWKQRPADGFYSALEVRWNDKVYVDDLNTESADSYAIANVRAGYIAKFQHWDMTLFGRVDNLTDENYVGSVIVNASGGRYYEPAPARSYLAGVSASYRF